MGWPSSVGKTKDLFGSRRTRPVRRATSPPSSRCSRRAQAARPQRLLPLHVGGEGGAECVPVRLLRAAPLHRRRIVRCRSPQRDDQSGSANPSARGMLELCPLVGRASLQLAYGERQPSRSRREGSRRRSRRITSNSCPVAMPLSTVLPPACRRTPRDPSRGRSLRDRPRERHDTRTDASRTSRIAASQPPGIVAECTPSRGAP